MRDLVQIVGNDGRGFEGQDGDLSYSLVVRLLNFAQACHVAEVAIYAVCGLHLRPGGGPVGGFNGEWGVGRPSFVGDQRFP
jgi:hypothetical protein